jgi:hypothetical protein
MELPIFFPFTFLSLERVLIPLQILSKETITRSVYSEHEWNNWVYGNELNCKFKGVSWFTLSPYAKGPRRRVRRSTRKN